eukprot:TRINITY_DN3830_c0_g1_i1.p1 TRINITY_DN3830_c0_g1~~TRINITY_DN3830_c0_g1_i1.p1  ORF type:complete len:493 (-),score=104.18 TRINITY_DN3830_c0_g1_i1:97-1575(-)
MCIRYRYQRRVRGTTNTTMRLSQSSPTTALAFTALLALLAQCGALPMVHPLQDSPPDWFNAEVASIRDPSSAAVFATQGLWDAIQGWDQKHPDAPFFGSDDTANKIMLAGFLGNVAQETGQLKYATELAPPSYNSPCTVASGNCAQNYGTYFGRGALQVTCWGGTYCANYEDVASAYGITDMQTNPDQVATNPELAWGSAIVFWMTNPGVDSVGPAYKWLAKNSFGGTYATINGALECPPPVGSNSQGVQDSRVANRIKHFEAACTAAGVDCSKFEMTCPAISARGTCAKNKDWACAWNGDCGESGPCNLASNMGHCSKKDWKCYSDADCGDPTVNGQCDLPANKGSCKADTAKDCWRDAECGAGGCVLPNLATCHGNPAFGCRKDSDCGQVGPCQLNPPGMGKCDTHSDWACWLDSDCGSSGKCKLPVSGVCDKNAWGCRSDSDCGENGPCWVNPGPTGVPGVCSKSKQTKCYVDLDCGKDQGPCVAPESK